MDHAPQVDAQDPLPVGDAVFPHRAERRDAGVVAHHVQAAEPRQRLVAQAFDLRGLRHVDLEGDGAHVLRQDLFLHRRQAHFVHVGERDVHALGREGERHGAAQAARRAGHGSHFPFELFHLAAYQSIEAPPNRIRISMNSTWSFAPMRDTSLAAMALPGMLATPITTPVNRASVLSRSKRWNSAALARSITIEIIASVASTAGVARPAPSRSETRMTPEPLAIPAAKPNTPEPTVMPGVPMTILRAWKKRRAGTEAMIAQPSTMLSTRASSTL